MGSGKGTRMLRGAAEQISSIDDARIAFTMDGSLFTENFAGTGSSSSATAGTSRWR